MRYALALVPVLFLVGCGGSGREARVVPDVRGQRLDRAESLLADQKLDWREEGTSGVAALVRSNWKVCSQAPAPGKFARRVVLGVAKSCRGKLAPPVSVLPTVPWLDGTSLEDAKERLNALDISYSVETDDGDPVLIDHLWTVCSQTPSGGTRAQFVELRVAHDCWED
jgi:beta-lactam-binding protein with PASTA domain